MAEEKQIKSCKVVLIGESGVGKTSITSYYIYEKFDSEITATTAASFVSKTVKFDEYNGSIKFDIWDTAGQEIYRSLAKIFYKGANAAVLVYDITDKKSFMEIKNYWYQQIKENSPNANKLKLINIIF
jgi:small GTP-binding protein